MCGRKGRERTIVLDRSLRLFVLDRPCFGDFPAQGYYSATSCHDFSGSCLLRACRMILANRPTAALRHDRFSGGSHGQKDTDHWSRHYRRAGRRRRRHGRVGQTGRRLSTLSARPTAAVGDRPPGRRRALAQRHYVCLRAGRRHGRRHAGDGFARYQRRWLWS